MAGVVAALVRSQRWCSRPMSTAVVNEAIAAPITLPAARRFTPKSIRSAFQRSMEMIPILDHHPDMLIGGIIDKIGKRSFQVAGQHFWYDRLIDPFEKGIDILLRVPDVIRQALPDGHAIVCRGSVHRRALDNCNIQLHVEVTELEHSTVVRESPIDARRISIRLACSKRRRVNIDLLLRAALHQGHRPIVTCITGEGSIVDVDIMRALEPAQSSFEMRFVRVNLTSAAELSKAITTIATNDPNQIVCVVRGGGFGLKVFDNVDLAETALVAKVALVSAIGHAEDAVLFDEVVDRSFTTPTALGCYLK